MTYKETVDYLFSMLPMYQRVGKAAYKADLSNTIQLLESIGNPQERFKSIHVAGTNGKGTSAHGIAAILQSAGYKTGLYTSPHLKSYRERIRINGQQVDEQFVIRFVAGIREQIEEISPSFFEVTVAMAFQFFAEQDVDISIIETGLGGRLDSTNVISPEVSLITNIGLDHTDLLGDTLQAIAYEKAGIIKKGIPVVIGEDQEETRSVFVEVANEKKSTLIFAADTSWTSSLPSLSPGYMKRNVPGIICVVEELRRKQWEISNDAIQAGLSDMNHLTGLKGRLQVLSESPLTLADVSHNVDGLKVLFEQVKNITKGKLLLIFATVQDKDLTQLFETFPADVTIFFTQFSVPRALPVQSLVEAAADHGIIGMTASDVNTALAIARSEANPADTILVTGSTFLVAEIENL